MLKEMLIFFIFSTILFISVLILKKQNYKQFHWLFIMFMILYNIFVALNFLNIKPSFVSINMDLSYNKELISEQLLISSLSILLYLILLLIYNNKFISTKSNIEHKFFINIKYLYMIFYPIAIYLVLQYPWPEFGEKIGFGNSLSAYMINIELVLLIIVFVYYNKTNKGLFLISYTIIMLIDTQRTPLLIAFIAYILVSDNAKALKYTFFGFVGILILSLVAIYRNGVDISPINMLYPFYSEGIYGSYCFLQSLEIVKNYDYNIFTNLMLLISPINDIIVKLIPSIYFNIFGADKHSLYLFSSFIGDAMKSGVLTESWSPMGGFFYPAESNLMIPYAGPILFTGLIFFITRKITLMKNPVLKVLLYASLFLYIKATIFIATKYIIFLLIAYYSIVIMDKFFKLFFLQYLKRKASENTH